MTRKRKPTYEGVTAKLRRSKVHFNALNTEISALADSDAYRFTSEIRRGGVEHLYRAIDPPDVDPDWALTIGDCIHNLRTALDHLAYLLVLRAGRTPNDRTQFPLRRSRRDPDPKGAAAHHSSIEPAGGVSAEARALIESVQPYHGGPVGDALGLLNRMDVIDKHRHLTVQTLAIGHAVTASRDGDPNSPPGFGVKFMPGGLRHGEVAAKVIYERAYLRPDPDLRFFVHVIFEAKAGLPKDIERRNVLSVLNRMIFAVEDEVLPLFAPLVA